MQWSSERARERIACKLHNPFIGSNSLLIWRTEDIKIAHSKCKTVFENIFES